MQTEAVIEASVYNFHLLEAPSLSPVSSSSSSSSHCLVASSVATLNRLFISPLSSQLSFCSASTASESRSAGSAAAGQLAPPAANRLLPPRPVDGSTGGGNSSMPTQANNGVVSAASQQPNLPSSNATSTFRPLQPSNQLPPVSSASCQKLPTLAGGAARMSGGGGGGGGGSIVDLTFSAAAGANSTPQPRIN
ncbi:hypothetical protein SprV_0401509300 [Sparganum proliferum]